jgi:hypothetical protein
MSDIIQMKITLKDSKPRIWRRFIVDKSSTFEDLHNVIQIVMGWQNCHLYEFHFKRNYIITEIDEDFNFSSPYSDFKRLEASEVLLEEFIFDTKTKFEYVYDMGDDWVHEIKVEKFLEETKNLEVPKCLDGEYNCPPEDCGGIWGFYELLEILNDKNHPEHKNMVEWIEWAGYKNYDPEYFDIKKVNKELASLR